MSVNEEKVWIYTGKGEFIDGVPARDLTEVDLARLDEFQKAAVEGSKIYRRAPKRAAEAEAAKPAADAGKQESKGAKGEAAPAGDKE